MTGTVILGFGPGGSGQRPGPPAGRLQPCPDSPNCVSSKSSDPRHRIAPIAYTGSGAEGKQRLVEVIRSLPRTRILSNEGPYLYVAFVSAVFRFADDVEFLVDEAQKVIHVRSASRVGYWDLGVNRRRVEAIRQMMATH